MLHVQMNTTTVNSGGRITASPRINARRTGSNADLGLDIAFDMKGALKEEVPCGPPCRLSDCVPTDSTFCPSAALDGGKPFIPDMTAMTCSAPSQQLRDM